MECLSQTMTCLTMNCLFSTVSSVLLSCAVGVSLLSHPHSPSCSLDDLETIDLHTRYTELLKAYTSILQARNDDRKAFEQQARAVLSID